MKPEQKLNTELQPLYIVSILFQIGLMQVERRVASICSSEAQAQAVAQVLADQFPKITKIPAFIETSEGDAMIVRFNPPNRKDVKIDPPGTK